MLVECLRRDFISIIPHNTHKKPIRIKIPQISNALLLPFSVFFLDQTLANQSHIHTTLRANIIKLVYFSHITKNHNQFVNKSL